MLKGAGVKASVTSVCTGREAAELLAKEGFDLCILEYALPDMTGAQLCAEVRERGLHTPMMFFTAMNRSIDREKAFAAGATEYLVKPDDLEIFVDEVVRLLNGRRPLYAVNQTWKFARAA